MATNSKFTLTVPIDASAVDEAKGEVKVAVLDASGAVVQSKRVALDAKKQGAATFSLDRVPAGGRVVVGPEHIEDEMLSKLQTIREALPSRIGRTREAKLQPIRISPYYWYLWWRWCREFTITGTVTCPDGKPVPGATVCAYDVDWFLFWQSKQLIGCTYTDINGAFQLKFKWCCGFWPWWWWWLREWRLDVDLAHKFVAGLPPELRVKPLPSPGPQPDLRFVEALIPDSGKRLSSDTLTPGINSTEQSIARFVTNAERLRPGLADVLPRIPGPWWPWYPWQPWYDCNPDVVFTVTQECAGNVVTIVDQGFTDVQPNIPTNYSVSLVANDKACCRPDHHVCGDEDCLILTRACDIERPQIGQDVTTPAALPFAGLVNPGLGPVIGSAADRPFAGNIVVEGTTECMGPNADYYGVESSQYDDISSSWTTYAPVPVGSLGGFTRTYLEFVFGNPPIWHHPTFAPIPLDGKFVYESRLHFEAANPWLCMVNCEVLFVWATSSATWADGLYKVRLHPYKDVAGHLQDVVPPLNSCGEDHPSELALRLDNRPIPDPLHPASAPDHPCGPGTVHLCSRQPDVDVQDVRLYHVATGTVEHIEACGLYNYAAGDHIEIDILAIDSDSHLGYYTLIDTYGENEYRDLLAGTTLTNGGADAVGPDYKAALSGGATAPNWQGGVITVTIPADKMCDKFPRSCCYQLELRAYKRTIADCDTNYPHQNLAEYSFFLGNSANCPE
jgi:hypothetical protein